MGKAVPVKITRPTLSGVVQRKRLFGLLDAKKDRPVLWISAPAGAGKTKLVTSYLDARGLPCLWYQCDAGDADLATFFYYMGLAARNAAPRRRRVLPLLTAEYARGIPAFARKYFESLYTLLLSRAVSPPVGRDYFIVLDNYQDVPAALFHEMLAGGLNMIPEGIRIVVISRSDPPAAFARLMANDRISLLQYGDIRFSLSEARALLQSRMPRLDDAALQSMHEKTEGWAAGIILMIERARHPETGPKPEQDFACDSVFDYFAGEIFAKNPQEVQDFLLRTAFLPMFSVSAAERLTGVRQAGRILSTLTRHNYFTERLSGSGERYRYHPLFRDFLLNRVRATLPPDRLAALRRKAGGLLEQSGQTEEAAKLYAEAGEGHALARMVIGHARELLGQGRNQTLSEWIAAIPGAIAAHHPWLLYWSGLCAFPFDMPNARQYLGKASALFNDLDDPSGLYLSWAGIVDTYAFELDEWNHLDNCIADFEFLRRTHPSFPSEEIDLVASSRMLICLILREMDQPKWVSQWLDRVSLLLQSNPSMGIRMDILFFVSLYHIWKGDYHKSVILLEKAEAEILQNKSSPFVAIHIKMMQGIHYWATAQYDAAKKMLSEGLETTRQSGVRVFESQLWGFQAATEMASGDREAARRSLKKQLTTALGKDRTLDLFYYRVNTAWLALLDGDTSLAAEHMEAISAAVEKMGTPYYRALWDIGMAQVAFLQGRTKEAKTYISKAHRISRDMESRVIEWYSLLTTAWILLQESRTQEGLESLRGALLLGRKNGYAHLEFYQPAVMQFLYAQALAEGIEPEYVKAQIRKLGLTPPSLPNATAAGYLLEDWPYPIKIFTLGRFDILKNDKSLLASGKAQKKPLEMVKALIAAGGVNVPAQPLTEALWPDADGDLAHKSFETTLGRLRRLLGGDDLVRYSAGQVSLDLLRCRVDSLTLAHLLDAMGKLPEHQTFALGEKAILLYQGPFLPADTALPWTVHRRERLKSSLLHLMITNGRHYEAAGDWDRAAKYYLKGLDLDSLAEIFYQRLMVCYQQLGSNADVARTYARCRSQLRHHLGTEPSVKTHRIYSSLLQKP
ncbi:MAG: BTAD domain-containing putative transcriptional regulator [Deltaproteobacteria bacterium]|nr:BTAD domain-containing putative transcriptional regulator [Deltaproteobacteria bacterium]